MKIKPILTNPFILLMEFIILWFFGIIALGYAISLTDTFSAVVIWIGGGMCLGAGKIIYDLFSQFRRRAK